MNFFQRTILAAFAGFVCSSSAEGFLSVPLLYPVENARHFNETSRYISGPRYSWTVSSYFPEHVQELVGAWHIQLGIRWLHTIPRESPATKAASKKEKEKNKKAIKTLISYYPATVTAGLNWEFNHLHYARPIFGAGYAFYNPLNNSTLLQNSFLDKKSYFITAGVLLSFDILDSNFSNRMGYEYGLQDMGLFIEYQKYYSLTKKNHSHWGVNVGLFVVF